ncbi:Gldg family protein [Qipengyuania sediminis]|uniref:Gldg family protein n=1 Tax=Qipengyuania sediminis TaxID=1532023 RepID=UPI00105995FD|nr:ABC transporter [Qipengyuania sediminis]
MASRRAGPGALALALTLLIAAGCGRQEARPAIKRPALGLMSSLPLYWGEAGTTFGAVLTPGAEPDWVRMALEERYALVPLDALDAAGLAPLRLLLLAQPRPLSPRENVVLDDWVRGGGRVLVLADPLLTRHSRFAPGDPRRPLDVALLSPILARWGLKLRFEDKGGAGATDLAGTRLPLDEAGTLHATAGSSCRALAGAVAMRCPIGRGEVVVFADAAILDDPEHRPALRALLKAAFG